MAEEAVDWRGALEALRALSKECAGYVEEGDHQAAKGCVVRLLLVDHLVLRLSHCPDMAPVYGALQILGMANGQSQKMAKLAMRIRTLRAERRAYSDDSGAPDLDCVPDGVVIPRGYAVNSSGVWNNDTEDRVAPAPILMTAVFSDVTSGAACVRLSWLYRGAWCHRVVPRRLAADARAIVRLADDKAPVTSANAAAVVRFLAMQEAASPGLPYCLSTSRLGWHGEDGALGFVLGVEGVGSRTDDLELRVPEGGEDGPAVVARALRTSGTLEQWRDAVRPMALTPRSLIGLGASAAAPLLGIVHGSRGFVIDIYGKTGNGKSTVNRAYQSVWGFWRDLEVSWASSDNLMAKMAAFMHHLPSFTDDTKNTSDRPERVARWCYDVTSTRQRGIGNPTSFQLGAETRTIGFCTGERSAMTMGRMAHGGAFARVLSVGGVQTASGPMAERLEADVERFYGTAGRAVIDYLLAERDRDGWQSIRDRHSALQVMYAEQLALKAGAEVASVARRGSSYLALIHSGLRLLRESGAVDFTGDDVGEAMREAVRCSLRGVVAADLGMSAMHFMLQHLGAHVDRMFVPGGPVLPPSAGWYGRLDTDGTMHILVEAAKEIIDGRFDWPTVRADWQERGWLKPYVTNLKSGPKTEYTKPKSFGKGKYQLTQRCFTLTPAAREIEGGVNIADDDA